mmetsp:Transcript_27995/g.55960  ORF Transcript_27995/g.55960 Transcript_27995/m.55960 type:complete len:101 (+) Transcript_27995:41-343(+)
MHVDYNGKTIPTQFSVNFHVKNEDCLRSLWLAMTLSTSSHSAGTASGIPVIIPTPLTRPSRKSILIPGRMYSGRLANSKRTFARLPGRNTIPSMSSLDAL